MEFGFGIPAHAPIATPENITTLAQQDEKMGFAIISVSNHLIFYLFSSNKSILYRAG